MQGLQGTNLSRFLYGRLDSIYWSASNKEKALVWINREDEAEMETEIAEKVKRKF